MSSRLFCGAKLLLSIGELTNETKNRKKSKKTLGVKPRHRVQNQALATLVEVDSSYNCTKPASMKDNSEVVVVLLLLLFKFCSFLDSFRCHLEICENTVHFRIISFKKVATVPSYSGHLTLSLRS